MRVTYLVGWMLHAWLAAEFLAMLLVMSSFRLARHSDFPPDTAEALVSSSFKTLLETE